MGLAFKNDLHDDFGTRPVAYLPYGGADLGEILAVGRAVGDGDDSAFHEAWVAAGDRLAAQAQEAERRGLDASARELFLRASAFYATSYRPLYGAPVDPRLVAAFRKQVDAFNQGLALSRFPVAPLRIPFENTSMPAYLIPAVGREAEVRPLLILTNGYDATITDMYFASAVAATRRGYHCLVFDGPGQGGMLYEQGIALRPDWETVVRAVVDCAAGLPLVDERRIVLSGWSLGGHLAPRAASGEHRLAACIADPGQWSLAGLIRPLVLKFGASPQGAANLGELEQPVLDRLAQFLLSNPAFKWKIVQRGFWVHGVDNLRDYLCSIEQFTMDGRVGEIACPTLMTLAENDPLAGGTQAFFDQLRCPKELLRFSAAEGAGDHCETANRSLLNRRVLDWLDGVL
ncbi:alpha/beta hydrolase family protein [Achromobacter deleyi]|uniref:alpha/beta hydrolase family protein n=1 Tax=Achromobacter deleyi TaxID=1353891 RepID=UPI001491073E|nr:alpha/beta fold hydrolase [Achromobacter deleyi]QVQ28432.1 alpha/beta fold hydrolase [Achromobacter deleyi]UIP18536.1 alpha/beta fold hydrolase [Achromobacter deleyi]